MDKLRELEPCPECKLMDWRLDEVALGLHKRIVLVCRTCLDEQKEYVYSPDFPKIQNTRPLADDLEAKIKELHIANHDIGWERDELEMDKKMLEADKKNLEKEIECQKKRADINLVRLQEMNNVVGPLQDDFEKSKTDNEWLIIENAELKLTIENFRNLVAMKEKEIERLKKNLSDNLKLNIEIAGDKYELQTKYNDMEKRVGDYEILIGATIHMISVFRKREEPLTGYMKVFDDTLATIEKRLNGKDNVIEENRQFFKDGGILTDYRDKNKIISGKILTEKGEKIDHPVTPYDNMR